MVVKTIFDVAEFQRKKKAALAKSGKTKLSASETAKLKKSADKTLSNYKNLKVVELTKGGKPTGRYFLRGELKTPQGGTRWRILSKADATALTKTHGKVSQAVKAKPAKKARGKKSPATKKKYLPGVRKASPKQNLLRGLKKEELLKVARHYNMRAPEKLSVAELRERIGRNKTEKEIKKAL